MVPRTTITLEDDLDSGPAAEKARFALGASEYEMDPSAANAGQFRAQLEPFVGNAQKVRWARESGRA